MALDTPSLLHFLNIKPNKCCLFHVAAQSSRHLIGELRTPFKCVTNRFSMDILTFAVEMTKAISWPLVTLILLFLFKTHLLKMIELIRKIRYKDIEVEIAKREIVEARELSSAVHMGKDKLYSFGDLEHFKQLADISPRAAITEAWSRVESLVYKAAQLPGMTSRPAGTSFSNILFSLREIGTIDPSTLRLVEKMRTIRNKAVHMKTDGLNSADAMDYVLSMKHVEAAIKMLGMPETEFEEHSLVTENGEET